MDRAFRLLFTRLPRLDEFLNWCLSPPEAERFDYVQLVGVASTPADAVFFLVAINFSLSRCNSSWVLCLMPLFPVPKKL